MWSTGKSRFMGKEKERNDEGCAGGADGVAKGHGPRKTQERRTAEAQRAAMTQRVTRRRGRRRKTNEPAAARNLIPRENDHSPISYSRPLFRVRVFRT